MGFALITLGDVDDGTCEKDLILALCLSDVIEGLFSATFHAISIDDGVQFELLFLECSGGWTVLMGCSNG